MEIPKKKVAKVPIQKPISVYQMPLNQLLPKMLYERYQAIQIEELKVAYDAEVENFQLETAQISNMMMKLSTTFQLFAELNAKIDNLKSRLIIHQKNAIIEMAETNKLASECVGVIDRRLRDYSNYAVKEKEVSNFIDMKLSAIKYRIDYIKGQLTFIDNAIKHLISNSYEIKTIIEAIKLNDMIIHS